MSDWSLEDVEEKARNHPDTYFIPRLEERRSQTLGNVVKLVFLLEETGEGLPSAERMWVALTRGLDANGRYQGKLENRPIHIKGVREGDVIECEPRHIASTLIRREDPRWYDSAEKHAFVSKMAMEPGEAILFAYRETPDREEDSGWRFFAGHEDDAYTDNPANVRILIVGWVMDIDPTLDPIIRTLPGAAFERSSKGEAWRRVKDWAPPK